LYFLSYIAKSSCYSRLEELEICEAVRCRLEEEPKPYTPFVLVIDLDLSEADESSASVSLSQVATTGFVLPAAVLV
jgi:hypothetical protein